MVSESRQATVYWCNHSTPENTALGEWWKDLTHKAFVKEFDFDKIMNAFGDKFETPNGHKLVQTQYSKAEEYQGPLEIISLGQNSFNDLAFDQFISLCSMPMLSFSNRPRLPAPIYWADLISKLDTTKWAKAVGRGFKLSAPKHTS